MKLPLSAIIAGAMLVAAAAPAAQAQEARHYDNGPVWDVSAIQTKPGHFNEYMKWLATGWKANMEDLKSRGVVLDYKVLSVADPRDNEPDLFLMIEYKNMAAMDVPLDAMEAQTKKMYGSVAQATTAGLQREAIRTQRGDMLVRELILK